MNILFVTATLTSGGSERVMSIIANKLCERGHHVEIICLNKEIVFYPIHQDISIYHVEKLVGSTSLIKKMRWLREFVTKSNFDVVIPFMVAVYTVTLLSLLRVKIPTISSVRNDPQYSNLVKKITRKLLLPTSTHVVVQTQQIKKYFPESIQKKTTVIFNPVNEKVFSEERVSSVSDSIKPKNNSIISVGRFHAQKNHRMMIEAFAMVADEFPDWKLIIYGDGPLRINLETLIRERGLENRVLLPGRSENVIEEIACSKVFCLSSVYEGMSNAMVEAICVGLPVISTKVSGTEELIKDGYNGYLVELNDVNGMALGMKKLMTDEEEMNLFGKRNRAMSSKFETETIVDQWETLINKVVSEYNHRKS